MARSKKKPEPRRPVYTFCTEEEFAVALKEKCDKGVGFAREGQFVAWEAYEGINRGRVMPIGTAHNREWLDERFMTYQVTHAYVWGQEGTLQYTTTQEDPDMVFCRDVGDVHKWEIELPCVLDWLHRLDAYGGMHGRTLLAVVKDPELTESILTELVYAGWVLSSEKPVYDASESMLQGISGTLHSTYRVRHMRPNHRNKWYTEYRHRGPVH